MGLESTEFAIAVEKALGLSIPDGDFRGARTPRELVNYLIGRIPEVDPWFGTDRSHRGLAQPRVSRRSRANTRARARRHSDGTSATRGSEWKVGSRRRRPLA